MRTVGRRAKFLLLGVVCAVAILPAAAFAQNPGPGDPPVAADGVIVKYEEGTSPAEQSAVLREEGLDKESDLGLINADVAEVEGESVAAAIENLEANPDVVYAEPDRIVRPLGYSDEPRFGELWGLHNTGQAINNKAGKPDVDINAPEASRLSEGGRDVVVAVIDDGTDLAHPDLRDRAWTNPDEVPENGLDDDGNGYVDDVNGWNFFDQNNATHEYGQDFHGTHVAGTIAASANDEGVVGVAPNVKVMALKWIGPYGGRLSDAIAAIEYAKAEGARISNNSWGFEGRPSKAVRDAVKNSGMLFVAAAGNGGTDGRGDDNDAGNRQTAYPASYDLPNILSVAAAKNTGGLARFSNYGAGSVDISAPGVDVLSSVPVTPYTPGLTLSSVAGGGKALVAGFGIEEIDGEAARASFMGKALDSVGHGACPDGQGCLETGQDVVLVDDDMSSANDAIRPSPDFGPTVSAAIESATGVAPEVLEVGVQDGPSFDGPDLSQLRGKTVVWETGLSLGSEPRGPTEFGEPFQLNLTRNDRQTLIDFLGGGGRLILAGDGALLGIEESSFVLDHLKVDATRRLFTSNFEGSSGTSFDGESYGIRSLDGSSLINRGLAPIDAAATIQGAVGNPSYEYISGTSMAAPHATGTAALVASKYPNLLNRPTALKKAIMENGKRMPGMRGKTVTGDMVDAKEAVANGASGR